MNIGVNLFGPARRLYQDFAGTAQQLRRIGFNSAELCLVFGDTSRLERDFPPEIKAQMAAMSGGIWPAGDADWRIDTFRQLGFTVPSAHIMTDTSTPESFLSVIPEVVEFGRRQGIGTFVISLMKGLEDIKAFVPAVNKAVAMLADAGIQLAYHNHDVECFEQNGTSALQYVLENCPQLLLQLDVGWAKFAGVSSLDLMKTFRDRIIMLHFKDIRADASPANRATCFTAVGEGSIPLAEIMALAPICRLADFGLFIDQDDSPGDILNDLAIGLANIQSSAPKT